MRQSRAIFFYRPRYLWVAFIFCLFGKIEPSRYWYGLVLLKRGREKVISICVHCWETCLIGRFNDLKLFLPTSKIKFFVTIVNSTAKSSFSNVLRFWLYDSYYSPLVTVKMCFPGSRKLLTWELLILFRMRKKAQGTDKSNDRFCWKTQLKGTCVYPSDIHTKDLKKKPSTQSSSFWSS